MSALIFFSFLGEQHRNLSLWKKIYLPCGIIPNFQKKQHSEFSFSLMKSQSGLFREPSSQNMRHMLALVLLRLLGTRVVHEDADHSFFPVLINSLSRREVEPLIDASVTMPLDLSGDSLFDWFLCVLHGLLSSCKPSWLKPKSTSKSTVKSRDFSVFECEAAESLQVSCG